MNHLNARTRLLSIGVIVCVAAAAMSYLMLTRSAGAAAEAADAAPTNSDATQSAMLADGVVTYQEHEEAIQQTLGCLAQAGLEPMPVPGRGLRPTIIAFAAQDSDGVPDAASAANAHSAADGCKAQYLNDVDLAWARQQPQPDAKTLIARNNRLAACVQSGGAPEEAVTAAQGFYGYARYANEPASTLSLTAEQQPLYLQCALAEQAATGLMSPAPW